ncbi:MAG: SapC family protein [Parvularculaceae bacterium]|nr:SapC family protein [Parvularculaceae bacterium]
MSQTPQAPQVSGSMLFYQRPELLNRETHGSLGMVMTEKPFAFCAKARAVPINITEVALAQKSYPIVFTNRDNPVMIAVLGVIDDVNLFVDDKGVWEPNVYVPAYIRRYPFAVANENGGDRFAVVIDAAHEGFVRDGGQALFANNQPADGTMKAIDFCKMFENERVMTQKAMELLQKSDLLTPQQANFTPDGTTEQQPFADYWGVDADRLGKLPDDRILELWKNGLMPIIFAHLMSFSNWQGLMNRRALRFGLTQANLAKPLNLN